MYQPTGVSLGRVRAKRVASQGGGRAARPRWSARRRRSRWSARPQRQRTGDQGHHSAMQSNGLRRELRSE